jgi:hypothetical protein
MNERQNNMKTDYFLFAGQSETTLLIEALIWRSRTLRPKESSDRHQPRTAVINEARVVAFVSIAPRP